jgi:hypothetical protein
MIQWIASPSLILSLVIGTMVGGSQALESGSTTWDIIIIIRCNNKCLLELKRRSDRVNHMTLCGQG